MKDAPKIYRETFYYYNLAEAPVHLIDDIKRKNNLEL